VTSGTGSPKSVENTPDPLRDPLRVAPELATVVRPASAVIERIIVRERDERLDAPLRDAAQAMRTAVESADLTVAVRAMYKRVGIDPTKTRPSSEALLRRVRRGDELPRINSLVDIANWCSLESQLPFGLYDFDRIQGTVSLRLGGPGEEYAGIRKDVVHVAARLTLADDAGPFGNPTSDSARTMVTTATTRALVVIFAPASVPEASVNRVLKMTQDRMTHYCGS
jgi:DNA/RNA-binding domain of Phe-tRNA-synthetase-like protein